MIGSMDKKVTLSVLSIPGSEVILRGDQIGKHAKIFYTRVLVQKFLLQKPQFHHITQLCKMYHY